MYSVRTLFRKGRKKKAASKKKQHISFEPSIRWEITQRQGDNVIHELFQKESRANKMTEGTGIMKISVKARCFTDVRRSLEEICKIKENHPEAIEVDIEVVL